FIIPPFGIFILPFIVVFMIEILQKRTVTQAFRASVGSLIGFLGSSLAQIAIQTIMIIWFLIAILFEEGGNIYMIYPSRVMTIAWAASGGSAGIHADLITFQDLDVYGMSVVIAIVGRHPKTNKNVHPITLEAIEAQFSTAMQQVGTDALKTGMLFSKEVIDKAAEMITGSGIESIVVDPVMVGKLD